MAHEIFFDRTRLVDAVQLALDDPAAYVKNRPWMGSGDRDDFGWEALLDQMKEPCDGSSARLVTFDWKEPPEWIRDGVQWLIQCFSDDGLNWDWFDAHVANLTEKEWRPGDIAYDLLQECGQRALAIGLALISFTRGDSNEILAIDPQQADRILELAAQANHRQDLFVLRRT